MTDAKILQLTKKLKLSTVAPNDYKLVLIPVGVVHGYKVLSDEPSLLIYYVTKAYNAKNPDEIRIDPHDKDINFDWEKLK